MRTIVRERWRVREKMLDLREKSWFDLQCEEDRRREVWVR
jgi:hypothetical protein